MMRYSGYATVDDAIPTPAQVRATMNGYREQRVRAQQEMRERLVYCLEDFARKAGAIHEINAEEFADQMIAAGWTDCG
jgi:hypothetical protein